jgi:transcription termination factor NusB
VAKQIPWDEQTDIFVDDLNETLSKKYNINVRSLLMSPDRYLGKKGIGDIAKGIKTDTESYFSQILDGMKDEQTALDTQMENATAQYKQIDSVIASKSAVSRVPYVKPLFVNRNPDNEETVVIEQYSDDLDALIGKLVGGSSYVADLSAEYKEHKLGSWLFSGAKNYVLTVNPPASPVLQIESSRETINGVLDDILSRASG